MRHRHKASLHIVKILIYLNGPLFKVLTWLALPYEHLSIFKLPLDKMHKQFLKPSKGECILPLICNQSGLEVAAQLPGFLTTEVPLGHTVPELGNWETGTTEPEVAIDFICLWA